MSFNKLLGTSVGNRERKPIPYTSNLFLYSVHNKGGKHFFSILLDDIKKKQYVHCTIRTITCLFTRAEWGYINLSPGCALPVIRVDGGRRTISFDTIKKRINLYSSTLFRTMYRGKNGQNSTASCSLLFTEIRSHFTPSTPIGPFTTRMYYVYIL